MAYSVNNVWSGCRGTFVFGLFLDVFGLFLDVFGLFLDVFGLFLDVFGLFLDVFGLFLDGCQADFDAQRQLWLSGCFRKRSRRVLYATYEPFGPWVVCVYVRCTGRDRGARAVEEGLGAAAGCMCGRSHAESGVLRRQSDSACA